MADTEKILRTHQAAIRGKQGEITFLDHFGEEETGIVIGFPSRTHEPLQVKTGPNKVKLVFPWNVLKPAIPKQ